ncbi:MAG: queuosine precursor transporter [Bryobacteraceae bacterium]
MQRRFKHLDALIQAFVVILIVSNLVAPKITAWGPFRISGAQLMFPLTYIFGDIFTEVYGYSASRRAIWTGFFASALLAVMGMIVVALPPAPEWHDQEAFAKIFGFVPRIVVASLIAYWCGEFANAFVMAKMKVATGGRHLWMRTIGSTIAGQLVDTIIVMIIVFAGSVSWGAIVKLIYSGYLSKVLYEAAMTPVTYLVVNALKRAEGVEVFDASTDFNPFASEGPLRSPAAAD